MTTTGKTRNLALLGAVALAGALSGCIVSTHNNTGNGSCAGTPALEVSWDIVKNSTNAFLSCAQAGALDVDITVGTMTETFPCTDGHVITDPFIPGTYNVALDLIDVNGLVISTFDAPITYDFFNCHVTDIGNVTFPVN